MSDRESFTKSILTAFCICVVCSVLVSAAAVILRPLKERNKAADMKKNILQAAGLFQEEKTIEELFLPVETVIVEIATGEIVEGNRDYDQKKAARNPSTSIKIPSRQDLAGIGVRANWAKIYMMRDENKKISKIVLPIHGKGLWSTMYGLIVLNRDTTTVEGISFYSQQETPGLGGEVDNPVWKGKWRGKKIFDSQGDIALRVARGAVQTEKAVHQIDGLSGATITSRGVENTIHYWLGQHGFGPFLAKIQKGEIK